MRGSHAPNVSLMEPAARNAQNVTVRVCLVLRAVRGSAHIISPSICGAGSGRTSFTIAGMTMRARLAAWRYRIELYTRRRWSEPELHEVELAVMGSAVLVGILALLLVLGRLG